MVDDTIRLASDERVQVRELRRCELEAVRDLYARLTPRTRYLRFLSPMHELPETLLRLLACPDGHHRLSLVAEVGTPQGEIVALAGYAATGSGVAEVGLVVRDDWQGRGLGTALAMRLLQAGEAHGFHRFTAYLLPENVEIRRILERVGEVVSTHTAGGVAEVAFVARQHAA